MEIGQWYSHCRTASRSSLVCWVQGQCRLAKISAIDRSYPFNRSSRFQILRWLKGGGIEGPKVNGPGSKDEIPEPRITSSVTDERIGIFLLLHSMHEFNCIRPLYTVLEVVVQNRSVIEIRDMLGRANLRAGNVNPIQVHRLFTRMLLSVPSALFFMTGQTLTILSPDMTAATSLIGHQSPELLLSGSSSDVLSPHLSFTVNTGPSDFRLPMASSPPIPRRNCMFNRPPSLFYDEVRENHNRTSVFDTYNSDGVGPWSILLNPVPSRCRASRDAGGIRNRRLELFCLDSNDNLFLRGSIVVDVGSGIGPTSTPLSARWHLSLEAPTHEDHVELKIIIPDRDRWRRYGEKA
ncbi:hypothetical protein C8J56DRAFT_1160112 [Mycena floridula]|nr:hypothetical protein C8J56DRAFT_1160112 [Mycena floridula]